ncbi:unnamed protein product [Penicillium glandicola]
MPSHHHCNAHSGLPRIWLGWGELGNRKSQLQAEQNKYFAAHAPDFKLRHPGNRRRGWDVHLDVIRKSTRWIDWRIHKTGDKERLVLPDMVRLEQVDSLINFFYTGDYSIEEADLNYWSVKPCPGGCVTCPQICQLLRIHLSMFQTALLLRITDLQAIAFRRFRDLMDTAPAFVLQYAVHAVYSREPIPDGSNNFSITGLKSVLDYRPELVLPAVLRYCGYYRMHPQQITRHGRKVRVFGESEFAELRRKSPKFDGDLARGIWLDTIDLTVPTIQFPGNSEPIRSLHPYMHTTLSAQVVDPKRSNFQYVTYLQPLPYKDFNDQRPSNTPTWTPSPEATFSGSFVTQTSLQRSQASVQQTPDFPQLTLKQTEDLSFLDDAPFDTTMDQINAQLTDENSTGPDDLNNIDWTHTVDWSGADIPEIDFTGLLNDDAMDEPGMNADVNALDLTQAMNWTEEDLSNLDFTQFLNDDTLDLESFDPSCLDLPMDMDLDLPASNAFDLPDLSSFDLPDLNSFDLTGLPDIDFSGLSSQDSIHNSFLTQQDMDSIFPGMDNYVTVPQEINFLPEPWNPGMNTKPATASHMRNRQMIQRTVNSAQTLGERQQVRAAFVSGRAKYHAAQSQASRASATRQSQGSRASSSRQSQDSTQTRYNLRSRPSMADSTGRS